jgi:hypothetical protein
MTSKSFEKLDLRDIVKVNVIGIQLFGYFCPEHETKTKRICYRIYTAFIVGFMYVMCILTQIADMITAFGDIEKMTNASFLTLSYVVQAFKLYPFIMHETRVRALINSINRSKFKPKNWEHYCILTADIKMSQLISKTWLFTCCVACSTFGIFPLLDKGADDQIRLPLSGWFPFKTDESPMFEIAYAYQIVTIFVNALGIVCMDTFMMGCIMVISGQLSVLNNVFANIKQCDEKTAARRNLIQNMVHYRNIIQ